MALKVCLNLSLYYTKVWEKNIIMTCKMVGQIRVQVSFGESIISPTKVYKSSNGESKYHYA